MSRQKTIVMTPAKIRSMQEEIASKTVALTLACLMDEYDFDREQLEAFAERFCRYNSAVTEHLITIHKVLEIIEEQTGMHINW